MRRRLTTAIAFSLGLTFLSGQAQATAFPRPGLVAQRVQPVQAQGRSLPAPLADWARTRARGPSTTGAGLLAETESAAFRQAGALDLANMPIEDAVILMMALISADADGDLRARANDMTAFLREKKRTRDEARLRREAEIEPQRRERARAADADTPTVSSEEDDEP